jgi:hypothetical protein
VPNCETSAAATARSQTRAWLEERGYRVIELGAQELESDLVATKEELAAKLAASVSKS